MENAPLMPIGPFPPGGAGPCEEEVFMKKSVYMEEMDAFTYREKLAGDAVAFIPVGALEQHGSHMPCASMLR